MNAASAFSWYSRSTMGEGRPSGPGLESFLALMEIITTGGGAGFGGRLLLHPVIGGRTQSAHRTAVVRGRVRIGMTVSPGPSRHHGPRERCFRSCVCSSYALLKAVPKSVRKHSSGSPVVSSKTSRYRSQNRGLADAPRNPPRLA